MDHFNDALRYFYYNAIAESFTRNKLFAGMAQMKVVETDKFIRFEKKSNVSINSLGNAQNTRMPSVNYPPDKLLKEFNSGKEFWIAIPLDKPDLKKARELAGKGFKDALGSNYIVSYKCMVHQNGLDYHKIVEGKYIYDFQLVSVKLEKSTTPKYSCPKCGQIFHGTAGTYDKLAIRSIDETFKKLLENQELMGKDNIYKDLKVDTNFKLPDNRGKYIKAHTKGMPKLKPFEFPINMEEIMKPKYSCPKCGQIFHGTADINYTHWCQVIGINNGKFVYRYTCSKCMTGTEEKDLNKLDESPPELPECLQGHTANIMEKKCECGAEKAGSPCHSTWCPMYIKDKEDCEDKDNCDGCPGRCK